MTIIADRKEEAEVEKSKVAHVCMILICVCLFMSLVGYLASTIDQSKIYELMETPLRDMSIGHLIALILFYRFIK